MPRMKSIKSYSQAELSALLTELGQPSFRVKQLTEWLYVKHVRSYDEMTNLPKTLRETLAERAPLTVPSIADLQLSKDGTRKYLLRLDDGEYIETVGIPSTGSAGRLTVCFSTQVGCAMKCAFCASGSEGFTRNLTVGEMVDQVMLVQEDFGMRVSNAVAMGQGEPFLNYDALIEALHILNDPKGIALGARHITVSTCGIASGIRRFSQEPEQYVLAVSLHSARQAMRDMLMPNAASTPLSELKSALISYGEEKGRRVTLEYLLLDGVNDSDADFDALLQFCKGLSCHVNFLPMNAVPDSPFQPTPSGLARAWVQACCDAGVEASMRMSRGSDINGACGQLKSERLR